MLHKRKLLDCTKNTLISCIMQHHIYKIGFKLNIRQQVLKERNEGSSLYALKNTEQQVFNFFSCSKIKIGKY